MLLHLIVNLVLLMLVCVCEYGTRMLFNLKWHEISNKATAKPQGYCIYSMCWECKSVWSIEHKNGMCTRIKANDDKGGPSHFYIFGGKMQKFKKIHQQRSRVHALHRQKLILYSNAKYNEE